MKQFRSLFILFIFLSCVPSSANASQMDEALQFYQTGDSSKAIEIWTAEATRGDSDAQYIMGKLHLDGEGVPQSDSEAVKWFLASAEQGYPLSQNALANMYYFGKGVSVDHKLAAKWWLLAAEQGMFYAQNNIAIAYNEGLGVSQDTKAAIRWFEKAAFQGHQEAMISLGGIYIQEDNSEMAYMWWYVASTLGNEDGEINVDILNESLPPEQIERAKVSAKKILYRINE